MDTLRIIVAVLLMLNSIWGQDTSVGESKACEKVLPSQVCERLRNTAGKLKEKVSIVTTAINAATAKHINNTAEIINFVNAYMAERLNCTNVLAVHLCNKLQTMGNNAKLKVIEVKEAILGAIENGANTSKEIVQKSIDLMKKMVRCETFLGLQNCERLRYAATVFGESTEAVKDAIFTAVQTQYGNAAELLGEVKSILRNAAKGFKCETVLAARTCGKIRAIAKLLRLSQNVVKEAIERAVLNGQKTSKAIYNATLHFLQTKVNCDTILGKTTCYNFMKVIGMLNEQKSLLQEALILAAEHQLNNTKEIISFVKNQIEIAAKNFDCTDILPSRYCNLMKYVAKRFKIRSVDLTLTIIEVMLNGTFDAQQIYDATLGALVQEAKDLKCEQLLHEQACAILKAFAQNFNLQISEVTTAIEEAIAGGKNTTKDIINFAKEFLLELVSCDNFLSKRICGTIERLSNRLNVKFKSVINKLKEWYANGVKIVQMPRKIIAWIWGQYFSRDESKVEKRSADDETDALKEKFLGMLDFTWEEMEKIIEEMLKAANHKKQKRSLFPGWLEIDGLLPGGLETGGLETGSLEKGGLEKGGLEKGGLEKGGLEKGGLEKGGLEKGGLLPGGLETGGLLPGGLNPGKRDTEEQLKDYLETDGLEQDWLEIGGLLPGGLETGGLETGSLEKGGLEKGGLEKGGLEKGGLEKGGLEKGGLEKGGLLPGGLETGGLLPGGLNPGKRDTEEQLKDYLEADGLEQDWLEIGGLLPGGLETGGLETGSLEKGGLEKGGLEKGGLEKGGLEKGGLEKGSLEKGDLIAGGLLPGGLETGSLEKRDIHEEPVSKDAITRFDQLTNYVIRNFEILKTMLSKIDKDQQTLLQSLSDTKEVALLSIPAAA